MGKLFQERGKKTQEILKRLILGPMRLAVDYRGP